MPGIQEKKTNVGLKEQIREEALQLGFSYCGIARNEPLEAWRPFFTAFFQREGHAGLGFLETKLENRLHPELLLKGTKSVIALLMNYYPQQVIPEAGNFIIAKYAYGRDYHLLIRERLERLISRMKSISGEICAVAFVDSGPVLEKAWAQRCGLGWQGKNTLIINKRAGSFFFIGIIFTDLILEPDTPETNHCGECEKCVKACPTGALDTPYQLGIRRCISYLTIESKEEIPNDVKDKLHDRIYGCDICQDVCPYNRFAVPHFVAEFTPAGSLMQLRKKDWLSLTKTDFDRIFVDSPIKRSGYQRLMNNIRAAAAQ
jgi:epoxyqueuosine reductase